MKFINPSAQILHQENNLIGAYKMSEFAARTCYASTDKMVWQGEDDKTVAFVQGLMNSGHGEPVECNAIYLVWDLTTQDYDHDRYRKYLDNEYSRVKTYENDTKCYVTTNLRVLMDNGWMDDVIYMTEPIEGKHELRISVLFKCQIVIASEINRYRKNSKGQRSTRFCNFSKDKFSNEINISMPVDEDITEEEINEAFKRYRNRSDEMEWLFEDFMGNDLVESEHAIDYWLFANSVCEFCYLKLTQRFGWKAQRARRILPLDTHTEMVHTAYLSDWKHFLAQRSDETTGPAHPDIKIIADSLKQQFIELGYIKEGEILK